ncbi:MAG: hypothetical protein WBA46_04630 [Thermomicrobiales bacterium]
MSVANNISHSQVAPKPPTGSPTFVDVPGTTSLEPSINANANDILADGMVYVTAYDSPVGQFTINWVDDNFPVLVTINGGTASSTGTAGTKIDRYEQPGVYVPVPFIAASLEPNIDKIHDASVACFVTTIPNATASPASKTSGQQTTHEWSADGRFTADGTGPMIIYEKYATTPTFTAGVIPVNVTPPTP